jgi:hypothetical protein
VVASNESENNNETKNENEKENQKMSHKTFENYYAEAAPRERKIIMDDEDAMAANLDEVKSELDTRGDERTKVLEEVSDLVKAEIFKLEIRDDYKDPSREVDALEIVLSALENLAYFNQSN